jgi:hypothetical protein
LRRSRTAASGARVRAHREQLAHDVRLTADRGGHERRPSLVGTFIGREAFVEQSGDELHLP